MDTSHTDLSLAILEGNEVLASYQADCRKRQSEEIFPQLITLMDKIDLRPEDITEVVITEGPGSYTGVRIAMTIAKVICSMKEIPLYTVGTLELFGAAEENCAVLLDARGGRVYYEEFSNGKVSVPLSIRTLEEVSCSLPETLNVIGDGHLVNRQDHMPDMAVCFVKSRPFWKKAENVDLVVPEYLKSAEAYRVTK